ncbi:MAG: ribose transport system substrate-binding protein [Thermomicrobiales bacterium]|jgi:ribose transport system substrate-binding protein|nr:ribose transport system substrate-binding protein [Thermomicrobiales bacterium]MEA2526161.1 ribose transport system substrate-binding protein [Thermomicrobiales bacterium]MEA2594225.1 ribose transport system substrate-binding protein [Thermomicrobiales bacterium]
MVRRDRREIENFQSGDVTDVILNRRRLLKRAGALGLGVPALAGLGAVLGPHGRVSAQDVSCPPAATPSADAMGTPEPASGKRIGVSVAYLAVPFYANFKTGLADGANRFGFEYELRDGGGGDLSKEVANLQDFVAQKFDLILLTPSGEGIIPGIKQANEAGIPVIEVNNRAGFESGNAEVVTYVGADDVEFGRLQATLLHDIFGDNPAKIGYVQGITGTSPQIMRGRGFEEVLAQYPQYEIVGRVTDDFDSAKALAVTQDLLTRFPKGELDVIVLQGPEGVSAADFARKNGREEVKFILGDYPADVRQAIMDGYVTGTINQNPYPQAFEAMHMAWLYFNGRDSEIPKPNYLPLPIITQENAEATPPAWGC